MTPNNQPNPGNQRNPNNKRQGFNITWIYIAVLLVLVGSYFMSGSTSASSEKTYSDVKEYLAQNYVDAVTIYSNNTMDVYFKERYIKKVFTDSELRKQGSEYKLTVNIPSVDAMKQDLDQIGYTGKIRFEDGKNYWYVILINILPIAIFILFIVLMNRRMMGGAGGAGVFNVGKSKAQLFDKNNAKVTFRDVAGLEGAKQEVEEIVSFLKNPRKYTALGGKIPKGALLVGPPGTGKTLLAKAVAGEADVPFFSLSGSDFVEMFVGVGASRVRDLFRQAKEKAPCIIFIDEIDAIGRARGKNVNIGSNDERESTLNQLLTEMDGFGTNSGVIILAATNRAEILDKALLRAGRFDRQIHVELPDIAERKAIFQVHLRPVKIDNTVDIDFLAKQTPGFSGADIANVCNEAALIAARGDKQAVGKQDFMDAVDRIIGGLERKTKITTDEEKRSIAFHEAGHATISWMLRYANPLVKVTIVPRGEALGAAWYLPEERQLTNRDHLLDEMCATLGGRAAEEVFLHQTSTGALNDLERVNKRAYAMVAYYGMSQRLPNVCFYDSTGQSEYGFTKPFSEQTAQTIDEEVRAIISEQYDRAKRILEEHQEGHHKLAQLLIEREVIYAEDLVEIFGERPWKSRQDEVIEANRRADEAATMQQQDGQQAGDATPMQQQDGQKAGDAASMQQQDGQKANETASMQQQDGQQAENTAAMQQ
ncbi:MAG: ATP-dependent zinc metalloprotease FtsH [Paludibacteraceae bacterium]|nr:ATP-dependent zinc metalloprotease FtsH [Paludibacteraceae bacterium]